VYVHCRYIQTRTNDAIVRSKLIKIGNSLGVRLPKAFLEEVGLIDDIEITIQKGLIEIRPAKKHPREGWAEAFKAALEKDPHAFDVLDEYVPTEWDKTEWIWE